ncbi:MAG TPA: L,D-transpeptidase family protein, partial [Steroidobacteraceae bacterium]
LQCASQKEIMLTRVQHILHRQARRIRARMRILVPIACLAMLPTAWPNLVSGSENNAFAAQEVRTALAAMPQQDSPSAEDASLRHSLSQMYAHRAFAPLWFAEGHSTPQAGALILELNHAEERGLRPGDYALPAHAPPGDLPAATDIARMDVALSLAAARFIRDLHSGRVTPRAVGYDLQVVKPAFDPGRTLAELATSASLPTALTALEPQLLHYRLLKEALARYRRLSSQPQLNRLPDLGKSRVRPGEVYAGAPALRRLLVSLGDMPQPAPADESLVLDESTVRALKVYQGRHGLALDGVLGRETYQALVTSFTDRVKQIDLSLERWRWLPATLDAPSIFVNIPQFRLFALYTTADVEQQMLRMDVIVGKSYPMMQTPVFAADMRYIVLHPYWDVPYSILKRELLPLIERDPTYIARNDYEIVQGQTPTANAQAVTPETLGALARGTLRLRQNPGPKNPLGFVKFVFPNRYDVYLHGTSAPTLFGQTRRALSHGCIRVADPMALIDYVLRNNPDWSRERVEQQLQDPEPQWIKLPRPIHVFIVYTTALAAEDGRTLFFHDIYGHDRKLQALLDNHSRKLAGAGVSNFPNGTARK